MKESIALLITGASGSIYAVRTFEVLKEHYDLHVVISKTAKYVMGYETGVGEELFKKEAHVYDYTDFAAPISSGSFLCKFKGVLVVPCSMGTLGAVASGVAQNLIHRVCDTALKERVPLVMLVREMPYNSIHLEPGSPLHRTRRSEIAIANAEIVIGFRGYLELCSDLLTNGQQRIPYEIGEESKRVERAIEEAEMGHDVALICSGDPGVYAMASLVFETRASRDLSSLSYDIEVVPGVTAALAASAAKGAILGHDHAYISLSDLLTPWSKIEQAIRSLAGTHLVVAIYNPRSKGRRWQFQRAISILKEIRGNSTYVLLAKSVTRDSENLTVTTLGDLDENLVDMETVVIVGSTSSSLEGEHIYTPRGYSVDGAC
jgi:4-hydroxy-3-polyprenylbenzoate decarboxylase